ncbi:hypothetical protein CVT24_002183 [Panaeolus cyanescens]|uniref:Uncharacterized protein n=1 Tax=Panaeolus cyanescens TaxID=181874 RepID=A0A409YHZ8_9AGAR|nr:hypothetical protein CVT24_002183 [Panaeolus cyanescens]
MPIVDKINTNTHEIKHSEPIPIASRGRNRSMSVSSSSTASSASDIATPASASAGSQRINIPSPSASPILSYFLAQSPSKPPATFPFKRSFGTAPVFEADEDAEKEIPSATHARRASMNVATRFTQNPAAATFSEAQSDRGTNLLRRLSLSTTTFPPLDLTNRATTPPSPPPNTAVSPTQQRPPFTNKPRRSATVSEAPRPRRAPSPMGERMLKGHFDGFN